MSSAGIAAVTLGMAAAGSVVDKDNINPTGYKAFDDYLLSKTTKYDGGVKVISRAQTSIQGEITETKNEFDYAIEGNGFFVVECNGERKYTSAGRFEKNNEGFLTSPNGCYLLGDLYTDNDQKQKEGIADPKQIKLTTIPLAYFPSQIYTDTDKIADEESFFTNSYPYKYQGDSLIPIVVSNITESEFIEV